ncbi:MFS general substrate transporter [Russula compacta]|nr:MFS general substrate transporter [Russula compacta]
MSPTRFEDDDVDREEETPFLKNDDDDDDDVPAPRSKPTPLPAVQISVLLSLWVAESVVDHSIGPYLNQLVRELPIVGGDGRKVGYYTGIIVSLHYAVEALTALPWNRLSDHVGRKPVLLFCLAGTIVAIILFGLSHSFWALVLSRCLHGAMKGNTGVVKSVIAELTDETNVAQGFSLLPMTWALGYVIGPFIGGVLSRPQDRWPHLFSHPFWANYPYFLPCVVSAAYACLSFVIVAKYLNETVKFQPVFTSSDVTQGESGDGDILNHHPKDAQKPLPLRHVLTRPVLISLANYGTLALLGMISMSLIPLVWSTPIEFGGLELSPASIGLWMSVYGCINGIFQFAIFPRAVGRFGPRSVLVAGLAVFAVVYAMFPFENLALRLAADRSPTWLLILIQLTALSISKLGYSALLMYISSASPNKRSLGATNGLAQTVSSVQHTVGPALADWLFAFSIQNNVLGGNFVYVVLLALVCGGLYVATLLPRQLWTQSDNEWIPLS